MTPLLQPGDLRTLESFEFAPRTVVEGYLSGRHRSRVAGASNSTAALCVPRLTAARVTPGTAAKTRSARATQEAQVIPSRWKRIVLDIGKLLPCTR